MEEHQGTDLPLQEPVVQQEYSGHHPQTGLEGQHLGNVKLPSQPEMNRWMVKLLLVKRTNLKLQLHQSQKQCSPRVTNRNREIQ
jgi:hypothetical protein